MSESDGQWGNTAVGASLTAALVALVYGIQKLVRRSRCASHTKCCDLDIARSETQRDKPAVNEEIILEVVKRLQEGAPALKKAPEGASVGLIC